MSVLEKMKVLKAITDLTIEETKEDFAPYIKNKDIPLSERWEAFVLAPDELKEHEPYGPTFRTLPEDFIIYEGPYHMDRGQKTTTKEMISKIEKMIEKTKDENSFFYPEYTKDEIKKVDIIAIKEEILEKNLGSFTFDW